VNDEDRDKNFFRVTDLDKPDPLLKAIQDSLAQTPVSAEPWQILIASGCGCGCGCGGDGGDGGDGGGGSGK
jgi:hypothetical protein